MHPIEHLIYYSCCMWVLLVRAHPLHFLYTKCHADISPVGGHDGHADPAPGSDYHFLHHHCFECNYGVPWPINLDRWFGTFVDWNEFKETARGRALLASVREPGMVSS